jgi:hypothetical protein
VARCSALCTVLAGVLLFSGCSNIPLVAARPTPVSFPSVAQLLREQPPSGTVVQIDAYYSKYLPGTSIPHVRPGEIGCPEYPAMLADTILPSCRPLVNVDYTCDGPPKGFIFIQAVNSGQIRPGQDILPPELPYHARFIGHLGDPKLAHCQDNQRIFVVDRIAQVFEEKFPVATP